MITRLLLVGLCLGAARPAHALWAVWQAEQFTAGELASGTISGPMADPDSDGRPNLLEYAFGSAPKTRDAWVTEPRMGTVDAAGGDFRTTWPVAGERYAAIRWTRPSGREDLSYGIELATTLDGLWLADGATERVTPAGTQPEVWRDPVPLAQRRSVFLRVRVSLAPPAPEAGGFRLIFATPTP